jgi:uncharacterized GH25 family protein
LKVHWARHVLALKCRTIFTPNQLKHSTNKKESKMMRKFIKIWSLAFLGLVPAIGLAHDTWVQSGPLVTRHKDVVHVDLMLGNHGNNHRDFKLASKITLAPCTLEVIAPDGTRMDLKPRVVDMGSAEKEGFWSAKMIADQMGVYQVVHTLDTLHGKTRAIKSSKSYFISSSCFGTVPSTGSDRIVPLNKGLEFVLETPIKSISANRELRMQVLWNGRPQSGVAVAFVPRGVKLAEEKDPQYERESDDRGYVTFTPSEGNLLLAVAHHLVPEERGEGFDKTHYGATMVLPVPHLPFAP